MKTKTLKQTVEFDATPKEVYELLMDANKYESFAGEVSISREVRGEFEVFDGYCHGYNIQLIDGKKIVQAWNFAEEGWPEEHYSICTFVFEAIPNGTLMTFTQTELPKHAYEEVASGWYEFYWEPMKEVLAEK